MKSVVHLLLFISIGALAACAPSTTRKISDTADISSGIMNGIEVPPDFPLARHVVAIRIVTPQGSGICTGTLLDKNLVLTAAHCAPANAKLFVVFSTTVTPQAESRPVDGFIVSPQWASNQNQRRNTGDIALLHFTGPQPATHRPLPILPAPHQRILREGTLVMLAGYGRNNVQPGQPTGSGILRRASTRLAKGVFSETEILVEHTDGRGACNGDSGGPAIVFLGGQAYVWGVTSRGIPTCDQGAVYTNAATYELWVKKTIDELTRRERGGRNNPFNGLN
ncbi:MAG: trypsin-like serine protease [Bdellovibrionaceae bacterium]|nr:trypsin-like serine protease [Pseudobdellovibrionaceae bacterium]MBX3033013.1 trypsin-like serine protease [Pseudobdellovibrionaceae bacterium]